jgi:ribosomal protein S18 acetylase RimI-like enzyme
MIAHLAREHVPQVAQLHGSCFSHNFSTTMGEAFLRNYFIGLCDSKLSCSFVYIQNGKVVGYITGGVNARQNMRNVIKHRWPHFILAAIRNLFAHPILLIRRGTTLIRHYFFSNKSNFYSYSTGGIEYIAVDKNYLGKGIAEALMRQFITEMQNRNIEAIRLGVEKENHRARTFYKKMGFQQINLEGTSFIYYIKSPALDLKSNP